MKTKEQLDEELRAWLQLVDEALAIRRAIVAAGGMATKTAVENELMQRHGMSRSDAHSIMNHIEAHNLR